MRLSRFTADIELDGKKNMLYNTASRQYFIYSKASRKKIQALLEKMNDGIYDKDEIEIITELIKKKIVVSNEVDEITELEYKENSIRYQDGVFYIMIIVTNACNFRCTYCIQEHESKMLDDVSEEKISKLLVKMSKKVKKIRITWFGGEPLLQFERMERMIHSLKKACKENHCTLENFMATNGYLLNSNIVERLKQLNFKQIQVTIDGDKKTHDTRRFLSNGKGTYDKILENLYAVLKVGMSVVLRINVDENSIQMAESVLMEFPKLYRKNIIVSIANLYQEEEKKSVRNIYEKAIMLGYQYAGRQNQFTACQVCYKNGVVVDTNAKIVVCANALAEGELGYIDEMGNMHLKKLEKHCKLKTVSALQNPECRNCVELPFCIGSCKVSREKDNTRCVGKRADGMSIEDVAKLDYLYDRIMMEEKV